MVMVTAPDTNYRYGITGFVTIRPGPFPDPIIYHDRAAAFPNRHATSDGVLSRRTSWHARACKSVPCRDFSRRGSAAIACFCYSIDLDLMFLNRFKKKKKRVRLVLVPVYETKLYLLVLFVGYRFLQLKVGVERNGF